MEIYLLIGFFYLVYLIIAKLKVKESSDWLTLLLIGPFWALIIVVFWPIYMYYTHNIEEKATGSGVKRKCFLCRKDKLATESEELELSPDVKITVCNQCFEIPEEQYNLAMLESKCMEQFNNKTNS